MSRTASTPRGLAACCLSLILTLPSPAVAGPELSRSTLRVSQPEAPGRKAGLEESLKEGATPPDPQLIGQLTQLARTLSRNYQLTMVPWEPISPQDWPQWRVLPRLGLLQYVPEDFHRFPGQAVTGLPMEAIALAATFQMGAVEQEHRDHGAAWALMTVMAIARARGRMVESFPGVNADFARLDEAAYQAVDREGLFRAQSSAFLQFLERVLYEERRGREGPQAPSPLVRELLEQSRDLRRRMRTLAPQEFYTVFRDHLWPVAVELLAEDMKQILFEAFQKEAVFRQPLRLGRRQKLLAWQGRLALHELSAAQQARLEPLLKERLDRLIPEEHLTFRRTLENRLKEGLQRMREYLGTGVIPPALANRPPSQAEILFLQRRIRQGAQAAVRLADQAIARFDQMAGLEERRPTDKKAAVGAGRETVSAPEDWQALSGFAQQLHEQARRTKADVEQASAGSQALPDRIRPLGLADLTDGKKVVDLADKLHGGNQEIVNETAQFESETGQFLDRVRAAARGAPLSDAERKALVSEAKQLRAKAATLRGSAEKIRQLAEEGELTTWEMMAEARQLALAQSAEGRLGQAAQAIVDWADPGLSQRKALAEALAETVVRVLERLRKRQEDRASEEPKEEKQEILEEEMAALRDRMMRLLEEFGIPEEIREQWLQAANLKLQDVSGMLEQLMAAGSRSHRAGPDGGVYDLIGADLLEVRPPADPGEGPSKNVGQPEPDLPAYAPRAPAADWEWRQREGAARAFQAEARKQRAGIVEAQLPLYRKYIALRQSLISTARAHLFQGLRMAQRRAVQTDLLEGEVDPDNLALVKTGTQRLFMEEAARGKDAERFLSLVIDVSDSMLQPADGSAPESEERRIDYVVDLAVTLAEAASRVKNLKLQVTIFSSWLPNASVVVKRFDEPWSEAKATQVIDQVLNSKHGGTNDVAAVEEEILRVREAAGRGAERMVWVLTDGEGRGAAAMQAVMLKNRDIPIFGYGLGEGMRYVKETFGPRGILIPRMADLVREGLFVLNREIRKPVKPWKVGAGLEEAVDGLELAEDGLPLEFPRLHPVQERPGAGELRFRPDDRAWFEVDGMRIEPPAFPKVTLSPWAVGKLQEMWDVYRAHPKDRHGNLLLYGQAGVGKSLYARYLWEIYRAWLRGRAARMDEGLAKLKEQVLALADQTQTRVVTFHEGLRKADLAERLNFGESTEDESGWTPSDIVEGARAGDQVVLSELNRASDDLLAELDEPLSARRKTLYERVVRFHPSARFVAAINPPEGAVSYQTNYRGRELSGQVLGHFTKVIVDYPRAKLPDGSDNPEHALFLKHERQVLREVRKRRMGDGSWAVPDSVINGLVLLADLVREDAYAGQAPFIVTTRALVRMVERLDRFPRLLERLPDVFFNAYWVDDSVHGQGRRAHLMNLIERVFKPANWPPSDPWPAPRQPVDPPRLVTERAGQLRRDFLTYPHWPADVRIPLGTGAGGHIPNPVFFETQENLWRLEDLLMDAELKQNILNMGDSDTGQSYFMEILAKVLRRNLIVLTLSQGFKIRDMLVIRWYSGEKTRWKDSLPLSNMRPEKVLKEGPPIVLWDRGEKGDPGVLAAFNDLLQERRVRLSSGEEFILPEGTLIALNRTPPRPPYEFMEQSAEWWDRFSHHAYEYPSEDGELEILHAYHPDLAEGSIRQVVKAGGVMRRLYRKGELFEPPGMGMTFAAAALMAQRPGTPVRLADFMIRAYGPLKEGEAQAIGKALADENLDVQVRPMLDPDLAKLMAAFRQIQWHPEVQRDPALWKQARLLTTLPGAVDRVAATGEPVQVGWGLVLRRPGHQVELGPLEVGLEQPFEAYARLAEALREKAREENVVRFRLSADGIFYQTTAEDEWLGFQAPNHWTGLWDLLSSRRFRERTVLTVELPLEDDAAWEELAWALDPVTMRRSIPVTRRIQGISRPIPLQVTEPRRLPHLRGFSIGADAKDPANPTRSLQAGFLIRAASSGLEEASEQTAAALIRQIPVLAGLLPHDDDERSLKLMDDFEKKWDAFLRAHPDVKHLVVVQEVGTPFLAEVLWGMGLQVGQLVAAARDDPEGVGRVVRPTFEQAMAVVREITDGWWSQLHAGEIPRDIQRPYWKNFFELMLRKQQQGYEIHPIVEQPPFEAWWQMTLWEDRHASFLNDPLQFQDQAALRQRYLELLKLMSEGALGRDEFIVNRQLVPMLESVFEEEEPEDLEEKPLQPGEVAVTVLRGAGHAMFMEPLLQARFAEVEPIRAEELNPEAQLPLGFRYEELLLKGGYERGNAPAEIERLLDQELEQLREFQTEARQQETEAWIRALGIWPGTPPPAELAQLHSGAEVITEVRGAPARVRLMEAAHGGVPPATTSQTRQVMAQAGLLPEKTLQALSERFGVVQPLPKPFDRAAAEHLASELKKLDPAGPKVLVIADPKATEHLQAALAQADPDWRVPALILEVPARALSDTDADAVLTYLLGLLAEADPVPGRQTQRLEGTLGQDAWRRTLFLTSRA